MNVLELKESIKYYTGKDINVNEHDLQKWNIFVEKLEKYKNKKGIDEYIEYMRYNSYKYFQFNYNS
jgi:hypothetical protein